LPDFSIFLFLLYLCVQTALVDAGLLCALRISNYGGDGAFKMRQIGFSKYEQQLSERATEALKQMTELKQLRELVRLAEASKALPKGLARSPVNPKILDAPSRFQLRDQPARPLATTGPSL
jgi:hypothetical protein